MVRSLLPTLALATATLVLCGALAAPSTAQSPTAATSTATAKEKAYPEVTEAFQTLITTHNLPNAIKALLAANRKYPELPPAHVMMYSFLANPQLNSAGLARGQLEEAVKASPNDPEPYVILGNIALQERRVAEATMDFEKAKQLLAVYKGSPERKATMEKQTLNGTALLAESNEDWKTTETLLRELLKLDDLNLIARRNLARALFWQGQHREAYKVLQEAKKIDGEISKKNKTNEVFLTPEAFMAQYFEQTDARENKKSDNPKTWFDAALKNAPKDLMTRQVVCLWALQKGNLPYAKEQADAAVRIEESDKAKYANSNVGHMLRGYVALWEKRWLDAEKDFELVVLQLPNDFTVKNNLALALVEQKDDTNKQDRALAFAKGNYDSNKTADALSTLGWVYFRRGEFESARSVLQEVIKQVGGLNNSDTATYWAHILHHAGKDWEAKELLDNILKQDQPFPMRREAEELYKKVKEAKKPTEAPAVTPSLSPKTP